MKPEKYTEKKKPTESLINCAAYTGWLRIEEWKYFLLSTPPM